MTVLIAVKRMSQPHGHSTAERVRLTKNVDIPLRIEPMIFWLAAQCLNQMCHWVPPDINTGNFSVYS